MIPYYITEALGAITEPWEGAGNLKQGTNFTIGGETASNTCFTGRIDDVSVFNGTLSILGEFV